VAGPAKVAPPAIGLQQRAVGGFFDVIGETDAYATLQVITVGENTNGISSGHPLANSFYSRFLPIARGILRPHANCAPTWRKYAGERRRL
jgi:hypothetical protein